LPGLLAEAIWTGSGLGAGMFEQVWALLRGRSRRLEFWLSLLALFALNIGGVLVHAAVIVSLVSLPFWLVIAGRRLHDFNQSWAWGLIPFVLGFAAGFVGSLARARGLHLPVDQATLSLGANLISLVVMIAIGVWPGTNGPNRFGGAATPGAADEVA
jgi:uncharacterized membrane protein YhaH (DUF805 family)